MTQLIATLLSVLFTCLAAVLPGRVWLPQLEESDTTFETGAYTFLFDPGAGTFSLAKHGVTVFRDAVCEYARDGKTISSADYSDFNITAVENGTDRTVAVEMRGDGLWDLKQTFTFFAGKDWFTTRVTLAAPDGVATNEIAPLVVTEKRLQNMKFKWTNVLEVPFDNDGWAQFNVKKPGERTLTLRLARSSRRTTAAG